MTSSRIRKTFHLKKSNLVEAACKNVDNMAVMRYSLCKVVIELFVLIAELHVDNCELTFRAFL